MKCNDCGLDHPQWTNDLAEALTAVISASNEILPTNERPPAEAILCNDNSYVTVFIPDTRQADLLLSLPDNAPVWPLRICGHPATISSIQWRSRGHGRD